jgi:hypothetical protein
MNFETFKNNVEQWALERGIYAHSTPEAQLLKVFEELGELARPGKMVEGGFFVKEEE